MVILFDIGGTNMRVAYSRDGKTLSEPKIVKTPKKYDEGIRLLGTVARELAGKEPIKTAAGGIAGPFNHEKSMLVNAPNLPQWIGKPVKEDLTREIGTPVLLENDTALGGLGEAVSGAGKGYDIVAYITVSTGTNGVRIVDGKIDQNAMGFEIGWQIIHTGGWFRSFRYLGDYISGAAIKHRYLRSPKQIRSRRVWDRAARMLAYGVNNTLVYWSPDIVVIGGSMMNQPNGISIERVRAHLKQTVEIFPELPPVEEATLRDKAGLHGALALIRSRGLAS